MKAATPDVLFFAFFRSFNIFGTMIVFFFFSPPSPLKDK
jgi:hypothetical protein